MYRVNSFGFMIEFTLIIISGIELPAMYKVNTLDYMDRIYLHYCKM